MGVLWFSGVGLHSGAQLTEQHKEGMLPYKEAGGGEGVVPPQYNINLNAMVISFIMSSS